MVNKYHTVENNYCMVSYSYSMKAVSVMNKYNSNTSVFAGWDLKDDYTAFQNSFSEEITYEDAIKYFTPNITKAVVNEE